MRGGGEEVIGTGEALGRFIRDARRGAGMTQEELAAFVGTDRIYIGRVERGAESRRLARVLEILHGLGFDLAVVPRRPRAYGDDEPTSLA